MAELPVAPAPVAPAPRVAAGRGALGRRLEHTDRDFTAEDYEMLLELDASNHGERSHQEAWAAQTTALLARLPVATVTAAAAGAKCSICLDSMDAGSEVRTLPCMHVFHCTCIDRWLAEPGRPPRCPIDQIEVQLQGQP